MRIDTQATLARRIASWRATGRSIGFSNGCFDLLHLGHIATLRYAKGQCQRLVVGIDDDDSVRALKGPSRPIHPAASRARLVRELRMVDAVIIFSADILDPLIAGIAPDVLVKGAEYAEAKIVGAEHAEHVLFAPMVNALSSTAIIERLACSTSSPEAPGSSARTSSRRSKPEATAQSSSSTG